MLSDLANVYDPHVTPQLQDHLFENNQVSGMETHRFSLSAINIMRGRDHGVPPYNHLRNLTGTLVSVKSFDELSADMSPENLSNLKKVYTNVDDVDAFSGGLSETPLKDAVLGPTFARKTFFLMLRLLITLTALNVVSQKIKTKFKLNKKLILKEYNTGFSETVFQNDPKSCQVNFQ